MFSLVPYITSILCALQIVNGLAIPLSMLFAVKDTIQKIYENDNLTCILQHLNLIPQVITVLQFHAMRCIKIIYGFVIVEAEISGTMIHVL